MSQRPNPEEYNAYYDLYIQQAPGDQILSVLENSREDMRTLFAELPADKWNFKYAPDKWTIKESILHVIDAERVFAHRAFRIGRHDATPLAGFEQDGYVPYYRAEGRSPESILAEYETVRSSTISIFQHLEEEDLKAMGTASGFSVSCRALGFMVPGHEQHHLRIIKERYL